jgi:hypothetical protein
MDCIVPLPDTEAAACARFWHKFGAVLQPLLRFADVAHIPGKSRTGRPVLPVPHKAMKSTTLNELNTKLQSLTSHAGGWVATSTAVRARLLDECLANAMALAPQLAAAGTSAKGSYEGGLGDEM